jgi:phenylalanyl-tRNA synthetase beta chain
MCKKRTLATIGTHDMKVCKSPINYGTRTPAKICFVPLKLEKPMTGLELAQHYEDVKDENMLKYLSLIRSNQVWPILYDATGE